MALNARICIVSPLFNSSIGGPGRQAVTMVKKLVARKVRLSVISRRLSGANNKVEGIKVHNISTFWPHIYNLSEFTLQNLIISMCFSLGAMLKLFRLKNTYEIVHFYGASLPLFVCLPMLKILNKKIVAKTTGGKCGTEAGGLDNFFLKHLIVAIFRHIDKFIAVNEDIKLRLLAEGYHDNKIIKIHNAVESNVFLPSTQNEKDKLKIANSLSDRHVFTYTGRLVEGKGLDILLEAMALILKEDKHAYLMMLGEGRIKEELKNRALSLGISDNICFKGNVDNIQDFLNLSDIFVFPSFSEGMPNSLLEAMSCGLPVIASKIGGVVDIVEDGKSGILFEPGDVSGLASAMVRLLNDNELRLKLGAEARKRIVENFSIDKIADEYINLYKEVLD